tara:strand:+ start:8802 stop:9209 length:408 start_codon:yes stop_codon:yes gene_type:complete
MQIDWHSPLKQFLCQLGLAVILAALLTLCQEGFLFDGVLLGGIVASVATYYFYYQAFSGLKSEAFTPEDAAKMFLLRCYRAEVFKILLSVLTLLIVFRYVDDKTFRTSVLLGYVVISVVGSLTNSYFFNTQETLH